MGAQQSSESKSASSECPLLTQCDGPTSNCPVQGRVRCNVIYNVYNQRIDMASMEGQTGQTSVLDPRNNMPVAANQQPYPGQRVLLPTDRAKSTIPKGGTQSTWVYPSPQMFYNGVPPVWSRYFVDAGPVISAFSYLAGRVHRCLKRCHSSNGVGKQIRVPPLVV